MLMQLFLILTIVWFSIVRWRNRDKREMAKTFSSGLSLLPFVGFGHLLFGSNEDRMTAIKMIGNNTIEQGGVTVITNWISQLSGQVFVVIADPVEAEAVLKYCLEKHNLLRFTKLLIGNGSVFAPASIWRPRRKVLTQTFGQKHLNQYVTAFSEQSRIMVERLKEAADKETFSIWKYVNSYSMDAVCQTIMGIEMGVQKQDNHPFLVKLQRIIESGTERITKFWFQKKFIYQFTSKYKLEKEISKYLTGFVTEIIREKRLALKNCNDSSNEKHNGPDKLIMSTLLELLITYSDEDKGFSDLEIQEEIMVMLIAGTDTSTLGASFTTVMLSKYVDIQEKVYQEIMEVLGNDDRPITARDLPKLKFLDAVIKETLRLYPPVPITARVTDQDFILPSGRKIVKDVGVLIHIWAMHRNPKYWGPDAQIFRPERFLDLTLEHPAAYMPFSYGPRNCIGYQFATMSMKTVLSTLIRRYKILPAEYIIRDGNKPLRVKFEIMMKHVDNFQVQLVNRK